MTKNKWRYLIAILGTLRQEWANVAKEIEEHKEWKEATHCAHTSLKHRKTKLKGNKEHKIQENKESVETGKKNIRNILAFNELPSYLKSCHASSRPKWYSLKNETGTKRKKKY